MSIQSAIGWIIFLHSFCAYAEPQTLELRVVRGGVPDLEMAQGVADEILQQVRVRINWGVVSRIRQNSAPPGTVYLRFKSGTRADDRPSALGYAYPNSGEPIPNVDDGARIVILYDRVQKIAINHSVPTARVLGHAIAHEIGHLLRADYQHAESGLMRARWTQREFSLLNKTSLSFAASDTQRMMARFSSK